MKQTILTTISASAPSRSALGWSARRAVETDAALTLMHVVDEAERESEGRDLLEKELAFARSIAGRLVVTGRLEFGRPALVLAAASAGFGTLVLGTHKTGYIHGRMFGSRFLGLADRVSCALAVIPDRVDQFRRGVVVGVEDSASAHAALRFALAEVTRSGQDLVLVSPRPGARQAELTAAAVSIVRAEGHAHFRIRSWGPGRGEAETLVDYASAAALLVLGRGESDDGFHAVNHDVLVNISSPVIVVPCGA